MAGVLVVLSGGLCPKLYYTPDSCDSSTLIGEIPSMLYSNPGANKAIFLIVASKQWPVRSYLPTAHQKIVMVT